MKSKIQKISIVLLVIGYWLLITASAQAASLYFSPSSGNYHEGENFKIGVKVETDKAINAVEGVISFPTRYLGVIRLNKDNSIVNLWIQNPSFSNAGDFGNVSFEGVVLNPGFMGQAGKIIDIDFLIKNKGVAELEFLKTAILANDGFGTNVTTADGKANFILLSAKIPSQQELPGEPGVQTPVIILKEVPQELSEGIRSILAFWNILPQWIKVGVLILIGVAVLISSFILLSFGLIILIYFWRYAFSKREVVLKRLGLLLRLSLVYIRRAGRKVLIWLRMAEKELESDITYSLEQLKSDFKEISKNSGSPPPQFTKIVKDYWLSIGRIIKRFFTKNIKEIEDIEREIK